MCVCLCLCEEDPKYVFPGARAADAICIFFFDFVEWRKSVRCCDFPPPPLSPHPSHRRGHVQSALSLFLFFFYVPHSQPHTKRYWTFKRAKDGLYTGF